MKNCFFVLLFLSSIVSAQFFKVGEVRGTFLDIGVGPRFPIFDFANSQNIGIGGDFTLSYTDNNVVPFFLYAKLGYMHFPGTQDLYKTSDYSSLSSNVINFGAGMRYYFKPVFEEVVLLMPVIEGGISYSYFEKLHQFKIDRNKENFVEEKGKFGLHAGGGISMFLLDAIVLYNYLPENQYLSLDIRIRIPIFIKI